MTKFLTLISLLLLNAPGFGAESLTQKADKLFVFSHIRETAQTSKRIFSLLAPMPNRIKFQEKYLLALNTYNFLKLREDYSKEIIKSFSAEEIDFIYDFRFQKYLLISRKMESAEQALSSVGLAVALEYRTGDTLGDFVIESAPDNVSNDLLRLANRTVKAMHVSVSDGDYLKSLISLGNTREEALERIKQNNARIENASTNAYAKFLSKKDFETLLAAYTDPKLGPLLRKQDKIESEIGAKCLSEIIQNTVNSFSK
jgi:hypothetical protein